MQTSSNPSAPVDPDIGLVWAGTGWIGEGAQGVGVVVEEAPAGSTREHRATAGMNWTGLGCCGSGQILTKAPLNAYYGQDSHL